MNSVEPKPHNRDAATACCICQSTLLAAEALRQRHSDDPLCSNIECRLLLDKRPTVSEQIFRIQRQQLLERRGAYNLENEIQQQHIAALEAREQSEDDAIIAALSTKDSRYNEMKVISLPSGPQTSECLDAARHSRYRKHLIEAIDEAASYRDIDDPQYEEQLTNRQRLISTDKLLAEQPKLQSNADAMCSQCRGGCCGRGGDRAYISSATIRRVWDRRPQLDKQQILALFIDRVADQLMADGCINQGLEGCVLPRELRSDVCNSYYCPPLRAYVGIDEGEQFDGGEPLLLIQRSYSNWNRLQRDTEHRLLAVVELDSKQTVDLTAQLPEALK